MSECSQCKSLKDKVKNLQGEVSFHKGEQERWRQLFNEQRGGEVFNELQRRYAEEVVANIRLNNEKKGSGKYKIMSIASDTRYVIAEEKTGRMLAVKVDKEDAELIARALNSIGEDNEA